MPSTGHGFQLDYPSISLHAISRPSIYCQLDESPPEDLPEDADAPMREFYITPQNESSRMLPYILSHFG
jgi:nucleotide-sensitive chloride channel 1A